MTTKTTKPPFDGIWNLSEETRTNFFYRMLGVVNAAYRDLPDYAKRVLQQTYDKAVDEEVLKIVSQLTKETPK